MRRAVWGLGICGAALVACAVGATAGDDSSGTDASSSNDASIKGNDAGTDAAKGSDASTCTSPSIVCADAGCTDLTSTTNHCGTCGTACTTADAGALVMGSNENPDAGIPNFAIDAGAPWSVGTAICAKSTCGVTCPSGLTLCGDGICYDTQNFHEHCGDCNTACAANEYCAAGHCCGAGSEYCNGACTDVLANNANCGACGLACTGGMTCNGGVCTACSNANIAPTATATTSGGGVTTYGPQNANDNVLETTKCSPYSWLDTVTNPTTSWIQYTWPTAHKITKVHVDTAAAVNDSCALSSQIATGAQVQWWNGSAWVTDGTVSNQTNDWDYTFTAPVTTTQVRLYSVRSGSGYNAFIFEWQVTGCN